MHFSQHIEDYTIQTREYYSNFKDEKMPSEKFSLTGSYTYRQKERYSAVQNFSMVRVVDSFGSKGSEKR